ncbi:MAG TPA: LysE family translocator [Humibacillus xanthopallidus]|nr:LysE family translocator [Humibacillus xanthopallidus]
MIVRFVATTWLLAMLPGVGQALMLRQTLTEGPRAAVATILGTATGLLIWSVGAGAGLSAAVLADPAIYRALLVAGGVVLAGIGGRTLWGATRQRHHTVAPASSPHPRGSRRAAYLAGVATNLANPKAGVFAITLLPAFAGAGGFLPTAGLGLLWSVVTASWYLVFVLLVSRGRTLITRPGAQKALGSVSGIVLISVGTAVALGH